MSKQNRRSVMIDLSKPPEQQVTRPKANKGKQTQKQRRNQRKARHGPHGE